MWHATTDGLDVALAYLRADGIDIMGYPSTPRDPHCQPHPPDPVTGTWTAGQIPWEWRRPGSFFDNTRDPVFFSAMTEQQRSDSINMASSAQGRLLTAWPLILFGVAEQLVYMLLTVAQGLTFLSFGVAILFAFFKKTEVIARSIVDLWIELIVQTDCHCADPITGGDLLPRRNGEQQWRRRAWHWADLPDLHGDRAVVRCESRLEQFQPSV